MLVAGADVAVEALPAVGVARVLAVPNFTVAICLVRQPHELESGWGHESLLPSPKRAVKAGNLWYAVLIEELPWT